MVHGAFLGGRVGGQDGVGTTIRRGWKGRLSLVEVDVVLVQHGEGTEGLR